MSSDNKQDDFYKQSDDAFWNRNDDSFWDSDERYMRKDEFVQGQGQNVNLNGNNDAFCNQSRMQNNIPPNTYVNQNNYATQNSYPTQNAYPTQNPYHPQNSYAGQNAYHAQYQAQTSGAKLADYKNNSRVFLRVVIVCVAVILIAVFFTVFYIGYTRSTMEKKIKELDFNTYTYQSEELLEINDCMVMISDAFLVYDSTEVWMPEGRKLIGIYIEASSTNDTYEYGAGIRQPYLEYDGHYVSPMTDQKLRDILIKENMDEEQMLDSYTIGDYGSDAGYYFFLVDEDATEFQFVIEERDTSSGQIEYLRARHLIELGLYE